MVAAETVATVSAHPSFKPRQASVSSEAGEWVRKMNSSGNVIDGDQRRFFLKIDGKSSVVKIHDLNHGGAKLECFSPPPLNAGAVFTGGELRHECRVAWSTGRVMGIQFLPPLSDEALHDLTAPPPQEFVTSHSPGRPAPFSAYAWSVR